MSLTTLPQNLLSAAHAVLEGFETLGDWTAGGGASLAADAVNVKQGAQSLQITTAAGVTGTATKTVNWNLSAAASFRISFYIADLSKVTSVLLRFSYDAGFGAYFTVTLGYGSPLIAGWNTISLLKSNFTAVGGMVWTVPIVRVQVRVVPATGQVAVVSVDNLTQGVVGTPVVAFTFDDEHASVYQYAYPALAAHAMRATAYTITDQIGDLAKMTAAQLQTLYAAGWDVANHTNAHTLLTSQTESQQETAFETARAALVALGMPRASRHVAYPQGAYNADTLTAMAATGMLTGRSTLNGQFEVLPPGHLYYLQCKGYITETTTLATAEGWVDSVIANGRIGMLLVHILKASGPLGSNEWLASDFEALVDYVSASGVAVVTITDLYRLLSGDVQILDETAEDHGATSFGGHGMLTQGLAGRTGVSRGRC